MGFVPNATLAASTPTAAESVTASSTVYIVQPGDNLTRIARRFGTTVQAVVNVNNITNPSRIFVGQRLVIPSVPTTTPFANTARYIVRPGDTLGAIARRFNTTVQAIVRLNNVVTPSTIFVGQRLVVPVGNVSPPSVFGFFYTVRPGDTLSEIAQRFGVPIGTLIRVNNIANPSRIFVGQRLLIP